MRRLVLKMSMSLDGFVASERPDSDWVFAGSSPDSTAWVLDTLSGAGTHAIGRRTFESWTGFWPTSNSPMAAPLNDIPKVVFSRRSSFDPGAGIAEPSSDPAAWENSRVAGGDLNEEVARLKQEPGGYILAQGGVDFCRSLVLAGLVDEFRFVVVPVALGRGQRLFEGMQDRVDLALVESTAFRGGALGNVYRPAGGPTSS